VRFTCLTGGRWENDKWYLLVANWSWPRMELSINGGPFRTRSLPDVPEPGNFGSLLIGSRVGDRGLLDEFLSFNRPLTREEAQLLYRLKPSK